MPNVILSPNMDLPVPVVSIDPGPDWANNINACLSILDGHNHSNGSGVLITPAGLLINVDLPFGNNNATLLRSVRFNAQGGVLVLPTDVGCLYEVGVDLYYNDGAGNAIRITQSGSIVGAAGTITGLPSGTAGVSYSAGVYTFQSATNTPGAINAGPISIGNSTLNSKTVTVFPNAGIAANYNIVLPTALPASANYLTLDNLGNLAFNTSGSTGTGAVVLANSPSLTGVLFTGGIASNVNSTTTDVVLTNSDIAYQVFNNVTVGTVHVNLPGTGVKKGDTWTLEVVLPSTNTIVAQAADSTTISGGMSSEVGCATHQPVGRIVLQAKINAPATSTDWQIVSVEDAAKWTGTTGGSGVEAFTASAIRFNNVVTINTYSATGTVASSSPITINSVPGRLLPTVPVWTGCVVTQNGVGVNGMVQITNTGGNQFNFWPYNTTWSGQCGIGGPNSVGTTTGVNPSSTTFTYDMYNAY